MTLEGHDWGIRSISYSPDDKQMVGGSWDKTTRRWDLQAGKEIEDTVRAPFEGHTNVIFGLALSFDGALLASTSCDNTIKLWAFESRRLLASFQVLKPDILTLSPNSRQLAYTTQDGNKIFICNTPPDVLASIGLAPEDNVHVSCIYLSFVW
ncbi:WD40 repeat-like protein [Rhizopogon salebrosus TDB-379]|nr:WD40 repeat-like protein [Rhizopogon salebrosus TDB-379]